jgi:hypothetical protein
MKILAAIGAGIVGLLLGVVLLVFVAQRIYYGSHGLAGGFEFWHLIVAACVLIFAFGSAFTAVLLSWAR